MSSAVLRLKRKASAEPLEGLVVAFKKSKNDDSLVSNEVYFKLAATVSSEKDPIKNHIQAALTKEKEENFSKWRNPKSMIVNKKNTNNICQKVKSESKAISEKNRLDLLCNRRLIFTETVPMDSPDEDSFAQNAEVRELFQLYDIIEENEDPKKQGDEIVSNITCNGKLLIPEKPNDYVFDVYIADGQVDESFAENAISLRPCTILNEDIYSGDSDSSSEVYEDEDDSNDENNWRNEYPEDENSKSDHSSEGQYDEYDGKLYYNELKKAFDETNLDDRLSDEEYSASDMPDYYGGSQ